MSKLVIIDSMAILHRAYHALPSFMKTKKGEPINAVYGLVSMLLRIIQDLKPTHIIMCFDRPEPTFRKELLETYQAQRPETAEELTTQFEKAKEVAKAMNIPVFEKAGFEADDLIGTIAKRATEISNNQFPISNQEKKKHNTPNTNHQTPIDEVVIVTGDKDQFQLVTEKVKLYVPITGLSNAKLYGVEEVKEKMGVDPSQIVDYKALVGDASDNYFGVPGIGPKTASGLLKEYKTLQQIYENLDKITGSVRDKLESEKDSADTSYKLAKIVTDVDIDFDIDKTNSWKVDGQNVLSLFNEYGFKTLTKRVKEVGEKIVSENQGNLFD